MIAPAQPPAWSFATAMSIVVSDDSNNQSSLHEVAALTIHIFTVAISFSYSFVSNITRWSFSPFILVYPLISYLVAPLLVFAATIINISFLTPFSVTCYIFDSLYPIYVFCGVACITGIVVGMGGRGLSALLTKTFAKTEQHRSTPTGARAEKTSERRSRRRRLRLRGEDT